MKGAYRRAQWSCPRPSPPASVQTGATGPITVRQNLGFAPKDPARRADNLEANQLVAITTPTDKGSSPVPVGFALGCLILRRLFLGRTQFVKIPWRRRRCLLPSAPVGRAKISSGLEFSFGVGSLLQLRGPIVHQSQVGH